jgi:hypothetical protein
MKLTKIGWIIVIIFVVTPLVINIPLKPSNNNIVYSTEVRFEKTGISNTILIDENKDFTSPFKITKPFITTLEPGEYYWKASGISLTNKFTIPSQLIINMHKKEDRSYSIENEGNIPANLEFRNNPLTASAVLDVGKRLDVNLIDDTEVIASQP